LIQKSRKYYTTCVIRTKTKRALPRITRRCPGASAPPSR
jgi:hypothetical protein